MTSSRLSEAPLANAIATQSFAFATPKMTQAQRVGISTKARLMLAVEAHRTAGQVIDELATLDVKLLFHGNHHEHIDCVSGADECQRPVRNFDVDKGSHLRWPLDERGLT